MEKQTSYHSKKLERVWDGIVVVGFYTYFVLLWYLIYDLYFTSNLALALAVLTISSLFGGFAYLARNSGKCVNCGKKLKYIEYMSLPIFWCSEKCSKEYWGLKEKEV